MDGVAQVYMLGCMGVMIFFGISAYIGFQKEKARKKINKNLITQKRSAGLLFCRSFLSEKMSTQLEHKTGTKQAS